MASLSCRRQRQWCSRLLTTYTLSLSLSISLSLPSLSPPLSDTPDDNQNSICRRKHERPNKHEPFNPDALAPLLFNFQFQRVISVRLWNVHLRSFVDTVHATLLCAFDDPVATPINNARPATARSPITPSLTRSFRLARITTRTHVRDDRRARSPNSSRAVPAQPPAARRLHFMMKNGSLTLSARPRGRAPDRQNPNSQRILTRNSVPYLRLRTHTRQTVTIPRLSSL